MNTQKSGTGSPSEAEKQITSASALIDTKNRHADEIAALEVAEDSREHAWAKPSFMAGLFMGRIDESSLFPFPEQPEADRKTGDALIEKCRKFFDEHVDGDAIDRNRQIPPHVMKGLADLGLFGMKIPKEYGGLGLSQLNYLRVLAFVCTRCASTTAMLSAHQSIGVPQPLLMFGTEEQKKRYLPRFAAGAVSAFALTEPGVGSDPAQMTTTATPTEDGNHYLINGVKLWCTNGAIADTLVVMARTPSLTVNGREKKQITAFIVDKTMPGFEVLHRCQFHGLNGIQNALLRFTNVKVPKENILLGLGKGLRLALVTLNAGRLSIPATCVGSARQLLTAQRLWGNERKQWGAPVGKHEAGAAKLADLSSSLFAMEAMTDLFGAWVDRKSHDIRLEAAIAKVWCSETAHRLVDATVQLRGGRGYENADSLRARGEHPWPLERALRDSRINMIVEGTSEILRLFIAREALDRHLALAGDVLNPKAPMSKRLTTLVKAGLFYAAWYPWQWIGAAWERINPVSLGSPLGAELRYARSTAHRLARTTFHLMLRHGPKLERRQLQLMRIVDVSMDLLALLCVIARARSVVARKGADASETLKTARLFCQQARLRIHTKFREIRHNTDALVQQVGRSALDGKLLEMESHFGDAGNLGSLPYQAPSGSAPLQAQPADRA
jgi:alkylation response protein AidB-like acyl-CoA dehydrogenase